VAFSPDGRYLAVGGSVYRVTNITKEIWNVIVSNVDGFHYGLFRPETYFTQIVSLQFW
jgi:hypothetical protein